MPRAPHLFACLEDDEWNLVARTRRRRPFDAVLVRAHYFAPYPEGHRRFGHPHDRLLRSIEETGAPLAFDLAVEDLGHPRSGIDGLSDRHAASPLVQALGPPIAPERLLDPGWQSLVADVAAEQQTKAGLMTSVGSSSRRWRIRASSPRSTSRSWRWSAPARATCWCRCG